MTPYSHRTFGTQKSTSISASTGTNVSFNPTTLYSSYTDLIVADGNRQGDRKTPQPFYFRKIRTTDQTWYRYHKTSSASVDDGIDISYIESNATGADWDVTNTLALYSDRIPWGSIDDNVWRQVYDQMRYGKGNLVVDLAEARETIKMIRNATSVRKVAREFVKGLVVPKNYSGSRRLKYASDKWLEYRYGWMPFISSTYELLKTLSKKVNKATIVSIEARHKYVNHYIEDGKLPGLKADRSVVRRIDHSARRLLKVRMRGRTTMEVYDFTSLNPLGIAWELTPLSFVADWFTNIGNTLSLWEDYILFANRFVDGFYTDTVLEDIVYRSTEFWVRYPTPVWPNGHLQGGYDLEFIQNLGARRYFREKNRRVLDSIPSPGGFRVEVNLNPKRLLDAAALIRGAFGNPKIK